jgi:hypothetical protein
VLSTRFAAQGNADEQSDAPKSANGAFSKWRDHRADLVIRSVISSIRSTFNLHMGLKMAIPYPENADGDFYVERDCCTLCDVPMVEAPLLFTYALGDDGKPDHCYVSKQPSNGSETESMISAIQCAELRCIRYRGRDQTILTRLIKIGESEICDNLE